jgi:type 2 lantibiotic biosynthesis protein LanM
LSASTSSHTREWLSHIVRGGSRLEERLGQARAGQGQPEPDGLLARWQQLLGGDEALRERLALSGWTMAELPSEADLVNGQDPGDELPHWAVRLERLLEGLCRTSLPEELLDARFPLPFQELHLRLAALWLQEMEGAAGWSRFLPLARRSLARYTAARLAELATPVLVHQFRRYLASRDPLVAFHPEEYERQDDHYQAFASTLLDGGLVDVFGRFPVLARQLSQEYQRRLRFALELSEHLEHDAEALTAIFGVDCGQVHGVVSGAGDLHRGGRSVIILQLEGSQRLVYKPRSLAKEQALEQLVVQLELDLRPARVYHRGSYGWMEHVPHRECPDAAAVDRCYHRLGLWLALVHSVQGNDCHFENLIVDGDRPVLIDAETLGHGYAEEAGTEHPTARIAVTLKASVLGTGFLPIWVPQNNEGEAYDSGGFGATGGDPMPLETTSWRAINSDGMRPERRRLTTPHAGNTVLLNGQPQRPGEHLEPLCRGFAEGYRRIMQNWPSLWQTGSSLDRLVEAPTRFIVRSTRIYQQLLTQARQPALMSSGVEQSLLFEQMAATYLRGWTTISGRTWLEELASLEDLDVPYFEVRGSEVGPGSRSGREVVEAQLRGLSEEELRRQTDLVRLVYRDLESAAGVALSAPQPEPRSGKEEADFHAAAEAVGELMMRSVVSGADGRCAWWSVTHAPRKGRLLPASTNFDLYSGTTGIAIFLAQWGQPAATALAHDSLLATAREFATLETHGRWGLFDGAAGLLYALSFLDPADPEVDAARQSLLGMLGRHESTEWDVGAGEAGRLLASLPWADSDTLARQVERLLQAQSAEGSWATESQPPLGGYAHGSAGVAVALLRTAARLDHNGAWEGARRALRHQQSLSEKPGWWKDLRASGQPNLSWCNGSAGIGLAALEAYAFDRAAWAEELLEPALQTVLEQPSSPDTCLCCGAMGGIELLLQAGLRLARPELIAEARRRAAPWARKVVSGQIPLVRGAGDLYCQGLFQGLAGLGLGFLRLADPGGSRSVLAWW